MNEKPRIVVADDSLVIRSILRKQLEEHGNTVIEAVDGEDALRVCREEIPDVILLDVEMPKLDGHGVLKELQRDVTTSDIPVVFLTGRSSTEDVVDGLRLGAHDYLRKPFEPAELVARVSAALRVKRLQDELRLRNAELEAVSRTDALTGLPNRRHLQEQLVGAGSAARRHGHSMGVLMIDVDHFKRVNDELGHESGDLVLKEVGRRVADACRLEDVAGRWGGEEFLVVVVEDCDRSGLEVLGERIRRAVSAEPVTLSDGRSLLVTVSIGAASNAGEIDAVVREADAALYEAKRAGRDRVVVSG